MPYEKNNGVPIFDGIAREISDTAREADLGGKLGSLVRVIVQIIGTGIKAGSEALRQTRR